MFWERLIRKKDCARCDGAGWVAGAAYRQLVEDHEWVIGWALLVLWEFFLIFWMVGCCVVFFP
jgi:hypothetical protein